MLDAVVERRTEQSVLEQAKNMVLNISEDLVGKGKWRQAIDVLSIFNRLHPGTEIDKKILKMRIDAFQSMEWRDSPVSWPTGNDDLFDNDGRSIPEISADQLSVHALTSGIMKKGALIVRGLLKQPDVNVLRECIDSSLVTRMTYGDPDKVPDHLAKWYSQPGQISGEPRQYSKGDKNYGPNGSMWVAQSPRSANIIIDIYYKLGLRSIISEYFGEPAVLPTKKWVLRRAAPPPGQPGWHQDGYFLNTENRDIRTLNMWISLSHCGDNTNAPGIEIIPTGERTLYPTNIKSKNFNFVVTGDVIQELISSTPVVRPTFAPGDAVFFDHYNLHRTAPDPRFTENRYAVETWFFASSRIPRDQTPILF